MRSGNIRTQIANAVAQARAEYYNRRMGVVAGVTVPTTVVTTVGR